MLRDLCRTTAANLPRKGLETGCLALLSCFVLISTGWAQQGGNVRIEILSDHSTVTPGSTFKIGVLYKMEPNWHIYWENYGDAGIETQVTWTAPEGITIGELQWEPPLKFDVSGIASYGYANTAVLWNEVAVADDYSSKSIELALDTDWLECEDVCIPGGATGSITIAVGEEAVPKKSEHLMVAESRGPPPVTVDELDGLTIEYGVEDEDSGAQGILVSWNENFVDKNKELGVEIKGRGHETFPYFFTRPGFPALIGRGEVNAKNRQVFLPYLDGEVKLPQNAALSGLLHLSPVADEEDGEGNHGSVLVWDISAKGSSGAIEAADASKSAAKVGASFSFGTADYSDQGLSSVQKKSVLVILALAFIGGLILNVMPCVLPVISLKIFSMVRQSGESRGHMALLGGAYTLGVLVSFWILAGVIIILQMFGADAGWGNQFQFPYFNFAMLMVLYVFGLSLLGIFEIEAPASVQQGAAEAAQKEGVTGAFFSGGLCTILATPCMAPILAPVVAFAITLSPAANLGLFSTVALGLAAPYLLLSLNPGWTRFMPKPGNWMVHFQRIVAFTMIAAALFPFWVLLRMAETSILEASDLFWRLGLLTLLVSFTAYLWGTFTGLTASSFQRWSIRLVAVLVLIFIHVWVVHPALQKVSIAPTKTAGATKTIKGGPIEWVVFSVAELEDRLNKGETVFIDFTAAWCVTCQVNKKNAIKKKEVIARFDSGEVTPMIADWTSWDDEITQTLKKFGRAGVPLYVVFPGSAPDKPIILPELLTPGIITDAFDKALAYDSTTPPEKNEPAKGLPPLDQAK